MDAHIGKIIERHVRLDKAFDLFKDLSKVGGQKFQEVMTRVRDIVERRRA